jgi:hypothetical protein
MLAGNECAIAKLSSQQSAKEYSIRTPQEFNVFLFEIQFRVMGWIKLREQHIRR